MGGSSSKSGGSGRGAGALDKAIQRKENVSNDKIKKGEVGVTIIRSTAKAHLIADKNGQQVWIQKRWLSENNTVSAKTFEKATVRKNEFIQAKNEAKAWNESPHALPVSKETEKAVGVTVSLESNDGEQEIKRILWFPKSAIGGRDGVAQVPGWMIKSKIEKLRQDFRHNPMATINIDGKDETYF